MPAISQNTHPRFSNLLPLPQLNVNNLIAPRMADQIYFKYYGLDFSQKNNSPKKNNITDSENLTNTILMGSIKHYFGAFQCTTNVVGLNENSQRRKSSNEQSNIKEQQWNIAAHIYLPENAHGSVYIVHGLFDHTGVYNHLISAALENNLAVFAFDLPGHGLSSGERAEIQSFEQYTQVFAELLDKTSNIMPKPWHVCGQSTGATIIMDLLQTDNSPFKSHTFFAPLVRPHMWQYSQYAFALLRLLIKKQKRNFVVNSSDHSFLNFIEFDDSLQPPMLKVNWIDAMAKNIETFERRGRLNIPLLIIQGDQDTTVDWRFNVAKITEKFPQTKVKILEQAGHQVINESLVYRRQWKQQLAILWQQGFSKL